MLYCALEQVAPSCYFEAYQKRRYSRQGNYYKPVCTETRLLQLNHMSTLASYRVAGTKSTLGIDLFTWKHWRCSFFLPSPVLTMCLLWAVVVAQLAERSLLTPEICGLNPVISKILSIKFSTYCIIGFEPGLLAKLAERFYPLFQDLSGYCSLSSLSKTVFFSHNVIAVLNKSLVARVYDC